MFTTIKACLLLFWKCLEIARMSKVISFLVGIQKATRVSKRGTCVVRASKMALNLCQLSGWFFRFFIGSFILNIQKKMSILSNNMHYTNVLFCFFVFQFSHVAPKVTINHKRIQPNLDKQIHKKSKNPLTCWQTIGTCQLNMVISKEESQTSAQILQKNVTIS